MAFCFPVALLLFTVLVVEFQQRTVQTVVTVVEARESGVIAIDLAYEIQGELKRDFRNDRREIRDIYWRELDQTIDDVLRFMRTNDESESAAKSIKAAWRDAEQSWSDAVANPTDDSALLLDEALFSLTDELARWSTGLRDQLVAAVDHEQQVRSLPIRFGLALSLIAFCLAVAFGFWFTRQITTPLDDLRNASVEIAGGNLDQVLSAKSGLSEFDVLISVFDTMRARLHEIVNQIRGSRGAVIEASQVIKKSAKQNDLEARQRESALAGTAGAVKTLSETIRTLAMDADGLCVAADATVSSASRVDTAIVSIASSTGELHGEIEVSVAAVADLEQCTRDIAENASLLDRSSASTHRAIAQLQEVVTRVEDGAVESSEFCDEVTNDIDQAVGTMLATQRGIGEIQSAFSNIDCAVSSLNDRSDEIADIVEVIGGIADETKLLSLNAAIIAAQAGEHGLAFGVVADQVSTLCERSSRAVREISSLVDDVRKQISAAVEVAHEGSGRVIEGSNLVNVAKTQISEISARAQRSQLQANEIVASVAAGRVELSVVASHAEQTLSVAAEVGRAAGEQQRRARQLQEIAGHVHELGIEVLKVTETYRPETTRIKESAHDVASRGRQVRETAGKQGAEIDQIETAAEVLDQLVQCRDQTVAGLSSAVEHLLNAAGQLDRDVATFTTDGSERATV